MRETWGVKGNSGLFFVQVSNIQSGNIVDDSSLLARLWSYFVQDALTIRHPSRDVSGQMNIKRLDLRERTWQEASSVQS